MTGHTTLPLSHLMRDTIDRHGLAWAVAHYQRAARRAGVDRRTLRLLLIAAHCHR